MSTPNYNIPCFSPPVGYQHKIDPNAAWIKSKPSPPPTTTIATGRKLLPPLPSDSKPKTPWGTAWPIWKPGQHVLVQLHSPHSVWHRAVVLDVLVPLEVEHLSIEELEKIPPPDLAKMVCRYTVRVIEEGDASVWTEIDERYLVPTFLDERLRANAVKFTMGERVLVQMSVGDKKHTHIGHISHISGDKVLRDKNFWHVIPRLYEVYINELETSGHWTAESIVKVGPLKLEEGVILHPPPSSGVTLQTP
ncbi:hypothetical protein OPQ81_002046 [Rhizoctonia solani]|nr:hypothetical protein OPQ81_002046 [Rhizoctonia solani]